MNEICICMPGDRNPSCHAHPGTLDDYAMAEREVSIFRVLYDYFDLDPPNDANWKGYCPWQEEHSNPADKAFRTYPEANTGFCFAQHGFQSPVRLYARLFDVSFKVAATALLERYGLVQKRGDWRERVEAALGEQEKERPTPQQMVIRLTEALSQHPGWATAQFEPSMLSAIEQWAHKAAEFEDPERLAEWFPSAVDAVRVLLDRVDSGPLIT